MGCPCSGCARESQSLAAPGWEEDTGWFFIGFNTPTNYFSTRAAVWLCRDLNYCLCWVHRRLCWLIRGCEPSSSCFHKQFRLAGNGSSVAEILTTFFFFFFSQKNVNATRSKHCTGCTFRAHSLPCSPTLALPLPAGRAPVLPAPRASSARVQLRTARSLESLPNQAFCYLAQVTESRGRWFSGCFLSRTVFPCVSLPFTGEKCVMF